MRNSKPPRRWIAQAAGQFETKYSLACTVSNRVAIVTHTGRILGSPKAFWGIYGYPAPQGTSLSSGTCDTLSEAKKASRTELDRIAREIDRGNFSYQP